MKANILLIPSLCLIGENVKFYLNAVNHSVFADTDLDIKNIIADIIYVAGSDNFFTAKQIDQFVSSDNDGEDSDEKHSFLEDNLYKAITHNPEYQMFNKAGQDYILNDAFVEKVRRWCKEKKDIKIEKIAYLTNIQILSIY